MGSGSIAIACAQMGFNLTACELDKDYYEAALKRIELNTRQLKLI
jgi:site-specific DNA-methyltransferase (adenine-specific)